VAEDVGTLDDVAGWLLPTVAAWEPSVVIAPSTAGVGLASTLARRVGARLFLATTDANGRPDGLLSEPKLDGDRALLVNDVVTTGLALRALGELAARAGASIGGAAWFATRHQAVDIPFERTAHVVDVALDAWDADVCELCQSSVELEDALDIN
jgi:orotate phosphoribosyltransferase